MTSLLSLPSFPLFRSATEQVALLLPEGGCRASRPTVDSCPTWDVFRAPSVHLLPELPPLTSGCNRPLELTFPDQVYSLIYLHVEEYESGRALFDDLADPRQAPLPGLPPGLKRSTFSEALNHRGLDQMLVLFDRLSRQAAKQVTRHYPDLGPLQAIDGTLIDATLSMTWAEYTTTTHKAKAHLGFDLTTGLPRKIILTNGTGAERPQADTLLPPGVTGVMDRGYQDHRRFDTWQEEGKLFICRIRGNTQKTILRELPIPPKSAIIFSAEVLLGDAQHRTRLPLVLIGLRVRRRVLWIVTNRFDLTALQIAFIYRLRWYIETFFAWWKRHLNVYHLIARSPYGLLLQLLAGLITYILLALYFFGRSGDRPSLDGLRQLRRDLRRERALIAIPRGPLDDRASLIMLVVTQSNNRGQPLWILIAIF